VNLVHLTTERNIWRASVNVAMNPGIAWGPGVSSFNSESSSVEQLSSTELNFFFLSYSSRCVLVRLVTK